MSMNTITKILQFMRSLDPKRRWALIIGGVGVFFATLVFLGIYLVIVPNLPPTDVLKDVRFQVPLRV